MVRSPAQTLPSVRGTGRKNYFFLPFFPFLLFFFLAIETSLRPFDFLVADQPRRRCVNYLLTQWSMIC